MTTSPRPTPSSMRRGALIAGLALAFGSIALSPNPVLAKEKPAAAPQPQYSEKFLAKAQPLQAALTKAKAQKPDAAGLDALEKLLDAAAAAATTADDKYVLGQFTYQTGDLKANTVQTMQGVHLMIDSGKAPADQVPKLHLALAQTAYQANDYATAQTELKAAIAAGSKGADVLTMLAEVQFSSNQVPDGLATLQQAIAAQQAAGQAVPDGWYIRGIQVADKASLRTPSADLAGQLAAAYPTADNWALALNRLGVAAQYPPREAIDLYRLMARTHAYKTANDYLEYVDLVDPHRLPGEAQGVLEAGIAAGLLSATGLSVESALKTTRSLIDADKATLPKLDRDAHAADATARGAIIAGDVFLGYGQAAKAAELYQLALTKPGADADLVNTRLGIAQCDNGDYAGAEASFGKVGGTRAPLAKLWTLYAQQKAAGKAP